jgi:hypothetical protein
LSDIACVWVREFTTGLRREEAYGSIPWAASTHHLADFLHREHRDVAALWIMFRAMNTAHRDNEAVPDPRKSFDGQEQLDALLVAMPQRPAGRLTTDGDPLARVFPSDGPRRLLWAWRLSLTVLAGLEPGRT